MVRLLFYRNVAPRRKADYNRNNHWQSMIIVDNQYESWQSVTVSKNTLEKSG